MNSTTEKALEAVSSLAGLVDAMRANNHYDADDTVRISRSEYDSLCVNQWPSDLDMPHTVLLDKAMRKPIREMFQHDYTGRGDSLGPHFLSASWELRNTNCIRLQYPMETKLTEVVEALESFLASVKGDIERGFTCAADSDLRAGAIEPESKHTPMEDDGTPF